MFRSEKRPGQFPGGVDDHGPDQEHGQRNAVDEDGPAIVVEVEPVGVDDAVFDQEAGDREQREATEKRPWFRSESGAHGHEQHDDGVGRELELDHASTPGRPATIQRW